MQLSFNVILKIWKQTSRGLLAPAEENAPSATSDKPTYFAIDPAVPLRAHRFFAAFRYRSRSRSSSVLSPMACSASFASSREVLCATERAGRESD